MVDFVCKIIKDLKNLGLPGMRFYFLMDNLTSRQNQQMDALIIGAACQLVFKAPYYPIDGSIEYLFNTIQSILRVFNARINDRSSL